MSFGFYNLAGGIPYKYTAKFEGTVIVRNSYRAQTNTNASFTFDFSIALNDETEKLPEQVISWNIGPIKNDRTLPLFSKFFSDALHQGTNSLAYSIMLPTDQILTISRDGTRSYLGTLLEVILPAVDFKKRSKVERYAFEYTNGLGKQGNLEIHFTAWDFFQQEPPDDAGPMPFMSGRDEIISQIYSAYEEKNKQKKTALFWMQNTALYINDALGSSQRMLNVNGVYQIDLGRGILEKAYALIQAGIPSPQSASGMLTNWTVELDGLITLEELS